MDESSYPVGGEENPSVGHERTDANAIAISKFAIALAFGIVLVMGILYFVFDYFAGREQRDSPKAAPMAAEQPRLPPEPRLQPTPQLDLKAMRDAEENVLNNYGWVDPDRGIARIPIDQALNIMAQKGFGTRSPRAGSGPVTEKSVLPEDSSSGRTLEDRTPGSLRQ
jgi:hypothetical protein